MNQNQEMFCLLFLASQMCYHVQSIQNVPFIVLTCLSTDRLTFPLTLHKLLFYGSVICNSWIQVLGPLLSTWETKMGLHVPGFRLSIGHCVLLRTKPVTEALTPLSLPPLSASAFQVNKQIFKKQSKTPRKLTGLAKALVTY